MRPNKSLHTDVDSDVDSAHEPSVEPDSSNGAAVLCPSCGRPMQRPPFVLANNAPEGAVRLDGRRRKVFQVTTQ